jgi:hypothetical protein
MEREWIGQHEKRETNREIQTQKIEATHRERWREILKGEHEIKRSAKRQEDRQKERRQKDRHRQTNRQTEI